MSHSIGIDLHKKTSQIAVLDGASDAYVYEKSIRTWPRRLEEVLAPFAPADILVEASTITRWVAPFLRKLGHRVTVADPNYQVMYASRPTNCKNDQKDARALAFALKNGHFHVVYEPNQEQRPIAEMLGTRSSQVRRRTAAINRVRSLYLATGYELKSGDADHFWSRVKQLPANERVVTAEPLLDELAMLDDLISASEKKLEELAAQHAVASRLMTVPGVGPIVSLSFYVKIGDAGRFHTAHEVESYLGLVSKLSTSAEVGEGGRITKQGPASLRALLLQAAWSHLGSNDPRATPIKEWFHIVEQRRGAQRAIVGVARKLAGILFAIMRDGSTFALREPKPIKTQDKNKTATRARRYQLKPSTPSTTAA